MFLFLAEMLFKQLQTPEQITKKTLQRQSNPCPLVSLHWRVHHWRYMGDGKKELTLKSELAKVRWCPKNVETEDAVNRDVSIKSWFLCHSRDILRYTIFPLFFFPVIKPTQIYATKEPTKKGEGTRTEEQPTSSNDKGNAFIKRRYHMMFRCDLQFNYGADYLGNFSVGRNLIPINRARIPSPLHEQIFSKRRLRFNG